MTDRTDIEPRSNGWRRLSYTRRCGWVDWGHALPGSADTLRRQMEAERSSFSLLARTDISLDGAAAYALDYGQEMASFGIRVSTTRHWIVKKGLDRRRLRSAALSIFMAASMDFERLQGSFPFSWFSNSSFSAEDLMSNVIGFYAAFDRIPQQRMRGICGEVSVRESYRIWDEHLPNGLGAIPNRSARPILFPTQEPGDTGFPQQLATIAPSPEGEDWVRPQSRFIDGRLINAGQALEVMRNGRIRVRRR